MVQPPYPPAGGSAPGDDDPGAQPWNPPGSDEPTQQIAPPGGPQRDPTRRLPQPGQYTPPGQYGPPAQYPQPGQYGQPPGQYAAPGQYGQPGPHGRPPGQYGPPGQYPPPGRYGPPAQYATPGQYPAPDLSAQPVHWQPWGAPGATAAPRKGNRSTVVAWVVAGIVALAAVGVALVLFLGTGDDRPDGGSFRGGSGLPDATTEPDGLGEDPILDDLAQSCYDGDMGACDRLYDRSDAGSDYETYGDTCAGRQPSGTFVYCSETFPED